MSAKAPYVAGALIAAVFGLAALKFSAGAPWLPSSTLTTSAPLVLDLLCPSCGLKTNPIAFYF